MLFKGGAPRADIVIDAGAPAEVQTAASEIVSYGAKTTGTAPQAFFVSLAVGQTQYLTSLLRSPVPPWVLLRPDAN